MLKYKSLLTCPKCRQQFVNKNQWHSCGTYRVEDFLSDKSKEAISLYIKFVQALQSIGKFTISPAKTRIAFMTRMRFAAIIRVGRNFINGHIILKKRHESPKFYKIEQGVIHHFRVEKTEDIDYEFRELLEEAHVVGNQEKLTKNT
jgi:hypothetical protein